VRKWKADDLIFDVGANDGRTILRSPTIAMPCARRSFADLGLALRPLWDVWQDLRDGEARPAVAGLHTPRLSHQCDLSEQAADAEEDPYVH
jgi:hypothetical protein